MQPSAVPTKLDVKKEEGITITWVDGETSQYSLSLLRTMCPCAKCKEERAEKEKVKKKPLLNVLPGNYAGGMRIVSAELVGNYAIKLVWSDQHDTGIYTFAYLRELGERK